MALEVTKTHLKVGIYPWIPDLGNDKLQGLKDFVKTEFEREHPDVIVTVSTNWDPYKVDGVGNHLSSEPDSFDILEIDTVLLGEVADLGVLQKLDPDKYKFKENFLDVGLNAVCYKDNYYAVPTLHCANFLIELIAGDADPNEEILCSLETGNHNLGDLQDVVRHYHKLFKGVSPLIGDFRGKWTLPCFYLDAYIDKHGKYSVQEGIDAPIDEPDVLDAMKWFIKLDEDTDGGNKGATDQYDSPSQRNSDIAKSDHVLLYGYSEYLSQVMSDKMCLNKKIHAFCIISPPLGTENNLLTFTDALIVNKSHYSDINKADAIDKFIEFYTSLRFRNQYAEGKDLKEPHPPRYVLISRKDFYTTGFGANEKNYQMLRQAMDYAVAAPNHGLADKHEEMNRILIEKLSLPPK